MSSFKEKAYLRVWDRVIQEDKVRLQSPSLPKFEKHLIKKSRSAQKKSYQRYLDNEWISPYSLDEIYYVYALLDTRKKGPYTWKIKGKTFKFPYKPFYIGKGKGKRIGDHVRAVKSGRGTDKKSKRIARILETGHQVIEHKVREDMREAQALVLENALVKTIGRKADGGPLSNIHEGGASKSGYKHTAVHKLYLAILYTGRPLSEEQAQLISDAKSGVPLTEEHKEALRAAKVGNKKALKASMRNLEIAHEAMKDPEIRKRAKKKYDAAMAKKSKAEMDAINAKKLEAANKGWAKLNRKQRLKRLDKALKAAHSPEVAARRRISIQRANAVQVVCPHCQKQGQQQAMRRWHFDNCRNRS